MHKVLRARVSVDIRLHAGLFCDIFVKGETSVKNSEKKAQTKEAESFHKWEDSREYHSAGNRVANHLEPSLVEVTLNTASETERERLFTQVSIDEEQEESCVEVLDKESHLSCLFQLFSLSWVANPGNKSDADRSQDEVDASDEVLERVKPKEDFKLNRLELTAD